MLSPAAFALLDPESAIVAITALGLALNLLVLFAERRRPLVAWPEVRPFLVAAVPGAGCGVVVLRTLPKPALQVTVGVAVVVAAVLRAHALRRAAPPSPGDPRGRLAVGFVSGALTTSAGVSGPPLALWLAYRGYGAAEMRDSLGAAFLGLGIIGGLVLAPVLAAAGADIDWGALAVALVCVVVGHAIGSRAFARMEGERFESLLLGVVTAAGAASIVAGLL
ncbi:MAG: uncharacterized protein V7607_4668 [Solirubrobacteraceae bacterium]